MEEWKDIDGYEGMYQVSNFGRVRSLDRVIKRATGFSSIHKGKILAMSDRGNKYLVVSLSKNDDRVSVSVHRLVAEQFLDTVDGLDQVNHIDGNKQNNHYLNLEWCNASLNAIHAFENNLRKVYKGELHGGSKLNEEKVREIRKMAEKYTRQQIADHFNVSQTCVTLVVNRRNWAHVS